MTTDVQCAKCKVALEGASDTDPEAIFTCPVCGVSDTQENVLREISEYVAEQTTEHISSSFRDAARRDKNLKFTEAPRQKREFRFIVDLGL